MLYFKELSFRNKQESEYIATGRILLWFTLHIAAFIRMYTSYSASPMQYHCVAYPISLSFAELVSKCIHAYNKPQQSPWQRERNATSLYIFKIWSRDTTEPMFQFQKLGKAQVTRHNNARLNIKLHCLKHNSGTYLLRTHLGSQKVSWLKKASLFQR